MPRNIRPMFRSPQHRAIPIRPNLTEYEIKVQPVTSVAEPEMWYWHLLFRGVKVNGGICENASDARGRAATYKFEHHRQMFLDEHLWDEESGRWLPKGNVVM